MGFFDRLAAKKSTTPSSTAPTTPPTSEAEQAASATAAAAAAAGVKPLLAAAREKLDAKDIAGAMAIYEELLPTAGDRADVLVTLSGDLGSCGYVEQIVELVAPRYDAERHGPATGLNLLQAYLATHNTEAAQHLLDILFGLNRPDLEERLHGFSNALAELLEAEKRGALARPSAAGDATAVPGQPGAQAANVINLVTISKPIWAYGIENQPGLLPTKGERLRRVAFAQLALLNQPNLTQRMKQPEDELGRFCRGFPLWMAETFYFASQYSPIATVGMIGKEHYALFGSEWTTANVRQLVETSSGIDYVFTGTLRDVAGDFELTLKVWEVKKFRERKAFTARWTPASVDSELNKLADAIRLFMEWTAYPTDAALPYAATPQPSLYCDTLATSLSLFLADKGILPVNQLEAPNESLPRVAARAAQSELSSLAFLTVRDRASRVGLAEAATVEETLFPSPMVDEVKGFLQP